MNRRVDAEETKHEGYEDGRHVVAGDHDEQDVVDNLVVRDNLAVVIVADDEQACDEVLTGRNGLLLKLEPLLPDEVFGDGSGPSAGAQAAAEAREGQVEGDGPHSFHHLLEAVHEFIPSASKFHTE